MRRDGLWEMAWAWLSEHRWIGWAGCLWVANWFAGATAAFYTPHWLHAWFHMPAPHSSWIDASARHDPRLGRQYVLEPLYDLKGKKRYLPRAGRAACLLFVYQCRSCQVDRTIREFAALAMRQPDVDSAIVVIRGEPKEIREFWSENGLAVPILVDTTGSVARQMNAVFVWRTYLFNSRGALQYMTRYRDPISALTPELRKMAEAAIKSKE